MRKNILLYAIILILFTSFYMLLPKDKASNIINTDTRTESKKSTNKETPYKKSTPKDVIYEDNLSFYNLPTETVEVEDTFDSSLQAELTEFLGDDISYVGLIYYNFSSKEYVSINENMDFVAASTYKVGLNLLYYYLAKEGQLSLDDTITYSYQFYSDGTGVLVGYCYPNMEIPISELLDLSIIYSDNIATNMLSSYLGGFVAVRDTLYALLEIDYPTYDNIITPAVSAQILKYIYDNKDLPGIDHLVEVMKTTVFHDRLDKYVPQKLTAHKIGSLDTNIHDIGLVFTDEPYLICIYTKDLAYADEKIAKLSKIIYNKHRRDIINVQIN